jgi:tellurite resistance protein
MDLDTPLIRRLRDHLLEVAPASIPPPPPDLCPSELIPVSPEDAAILERFRPYAELFILVASSDGKIDPEERHVMRGAFESLTGGRVAQASLRTLEAELIAQVVDGDRDELMEQLCYAFSHDQEEAELAFTLAAVVAFANRQVETNEGSLVAQLASWLRISKARAYQLLESGQRSLRPYPG